MCSKENMLLEIKVIQKFKLSKNVFFINNLLINYYLFIIEKKIRLIWMILEIGNCFWRIYFGTMNCHSLYSQNIIISCELRCCLTAYFANYDPPLKKFPNRTDASLYMILCLAALAVHATLPPLSLTTPPTAAPHRLCCHRRRRRRRWDGFALPAASC